MKVTFSPITTNGMRFCESDMPHLVDEHPHDAAFDEPQESPRELPPIFRC